MSVAEEEDVVPIPTQTQPASEQPKKQKPPKTKKSLTAPHPHSSQLTSAFFAAGVEDAPEYRQLFWQSVELPGQESARPPTTESEAETVSHSINRIRRKLFSRHPEAQSSEAPSSEAQSSETESLLPPNQQNQQQHDEEPLEPIDIDSTPEDLHFSDDDEDDDDSNSDPPFKTFSSSPPSSRFKKKRKSQKPESLTEALDTNTQNQTMKERKKRADTVRLESLNAALEQLWEMAGEKYVPLTGVCNSFKNAGPKRRNHVVRVIEQAKRIVAKLTVPSDYDQAVEEAERRHAERAIRLANSEEYDVLRQLYKDETSAQVKRALLSIVCMKDGSSYLHNKEKIVRDFGVKPHTVDNMRRQLVLNSFGDMIMKDSAVRERMDPAKVEDFLTFCYQSGLISHLSFGTTQLKLTTKQKLRIGACVQAGISGHIIASYLKARADVPDFKALSSRSLYRILNEWLKLRPTKAASGLDNFLVDGHEALKSLKSLLDKMRNDQRCSAEEHAAFLSKISEIRRNMTVGLSAELSTSSSCAYHCATCALSNPDPKSLHHDECGLSHTTFCVACSVIDELIPELKQLVSKGATPANEKQRDMHKLCRAEVAVADWRRHLVQCFQQRAGRTNALELVDSDPSTCLIIIDWANKLLPRVHNECTRDYYKKSGMSLLAFVVVGLTDSSDPDSRIGRSVYSYLIAKCDQGPQAVLSCYADMLRHLKVERPNFNRVIVKADNAGCFKSALFLRGAAYFANANCYQCVSVLFNAPGDGKDLVDGYFGQLKMLLTARLNAGVSQLNVKEIHDCVRQSPVRIEGSNMTVVKLIYSNEQQQASEQDDREQDAQPAPRGKQKQKAGKRTKKAATDQQPRGEKIRSYLYFRYEQHNIFAHNYYGIGKGELFARWDSDSPVWIPQLVTECEFLPPAVPSGKAALAEASDPMDLIDYSAPELPNRIPASDMVKLSFHTLVSGHKRGAVVDQTAPGRDAQGETTQRSHPVSEGWARNKPATRHTYSKKQVWFLKLRFEPGVDDPGKRATPEGVATEMESWKVADRYVFATDELLTKRQIGDFFSRQEASCKAGKYQRLPANREDVLKEILAAISDQPDLTPEETIDVVEQPNDDEVQERNQAELILDYAQVGQQEVFGGVNGDFAVYRRLPTEPLELGRITGISNDHVYISVAEHMVTGETETGNLLAQELAGKELHGLPVTSILKLLTPVNFDSSTGYYEFDVQQDWWKAQESASETTPKQPRLEPGVSRKPAKHHRPERGASRKQGQKQQRRSETTLSAAPQQPTEPERQQSTGMTTRSASKRGQPDAAVVHDVHVSPTKRPRTPAAAPKRGQPDAAVVHDVHVSPTKRPRTPAAAPKRGQPDAAVVHDVHVSPTKRPRTPAAAPKRGQPDAAVVHDVHVSPTKRPRTPAPTENAVASRFVHFSNPDKVSCYANAAIVALLGLADPFWATYALERQRPGPNLDPLRQRLADVLLDYHSKEAKQSAATTETALGIRELVDQLNARYPDTVRGREADVLFAEMEQQDTLDFMGSLLQHMPEDVKRLFSFETLRYAKCTECDATPYATEPEPSLYWMVKPPTVAKDDRTGRWVARANSIGDCTKDVETANRCTRCGKEDAKHLSTELLLCGPQQQYLIMPFDSLTFDRVNQRYHQCSVELAEFNVDGIDLPTLDAVNETSVRFAVVSVICYRASGQLSSRSESRMSGHYWAYRSVGDGRFVKINDEHVAATSVKWSAFGDIKNVRALLCRRV